MSPMWKQEPTSSGIGRAVFAGCNPIIATPCVLGDERRRRGPPGRCWRDDLDGSNKVWREITKDLCPTVRHIKMVYFLIYLFS